MKCQGDGMFDNLRLRKIVSPKTESLPNAENFRFSVSAGHINAERLSRRGPVLTWNHARAEKRRAEANRSCTFGIATLYKKKADKIRPVDSDATDGQVPGGRDDWQERAWKRLEATAKKNEDKNSKYYGILTPRTTDMPRGSRLTKQRRKDLIVGEDITPAERELLEECLLNREKSLAWTFMEMGRVQSDVAPPQKIRTIPHKAWQAASFPIPRAIRPKVAGKVQERINAGVYERCEGPYRNPWFVVKKKNGDFRIVNAAMNINAVTIRDATLPPSADEFSEHVAGMHVSSLIDWFSGYDQVGLDEGSRDLTAFHTMTHGLLRQTTLPQGATNSVGQFVRIGLRILEKSPAEPYIDDIAVDGPKTDYEQAESEVLPGVRRFMLEHIMNLDKSLLAIECAEATVSGEKSQWCMPGLKVVGYVCDATGRHPEAAKVEKIINWKQPDNPSEVKGFLGICVYYRIWVEGFATIAGPLYALTRKNATFKFNEDCKRAMLTLQERLTSAPALITIEYADDSGKIVLVVDASPTGWGAVLMQEKRAANGKWKRHPVRYESGIWSDAEAKYDQLKRECRGLLKALKKFRFWLYGVHFYVETDANTLCAQLNRSATDLPGALVTQWIAWIRLFDFEIKHIDGTKNQAADALSRRPSTDEDIVERANEEDIDDWIDAQLSALRITTPAEDTVASLSTECNEGGEEGNGGRILLEEYSNEYEEIAIFLTNGMKKRPEHTRAEHTAFRNRALKFIVRDGHLFRKERTDPLPRRVICNPETQSQIIKSLHDDAGHRRREATYQRLRDRYFWEGMYTHTRKYCETCTECQLRESLRQHEELTPTYTDHRWQKVGLDIVHMPKNKGKKYLVMARSDLSGWVEGRALASASSTLVAQFLYEDIICRHGIFQKLVVDGGPENKGLTKDLAEKYGIRRVVVSAYHPEANGLVERGHAPVVNALSKMTGGLTHWVEHLHTVLWADRTTVRRSTGMTPYEVEYAARPVLPIDLDVPTWMVMNWDDVKNYEDLIAMRARILERRDEDVAEVAAYLKRMRQANKDDFDAKHRTRPERLQKGQLVLLRNTERDVDMSTKQKLAFRWLGPYVVRDVVEEKGTYLLCEVGNDGAQLRGTFAGNRLIPFRQRELNTPSGNDVETQPITEQRSGSWVAQDPPAEGPDQSQHEEDGNSESDKDDSDQAVDVRRGEGGINTSPSLSFPQEFSPSTEPCHWKDFQSGGAGKMRLRGTPGILRSSGRPGDRNVLQAQNTRPSIRINVPPLPADQAEYVPLLMRGRGRRRGQIPARGRGRPRKVLAVRDETEE